MNVPKRIADCIDILDAIPENEEYIEDVALDVERLDDSVHGRDL